jgi:restriction endonuclease S subunit
VGHIRDIYRKNKNIFKDIKLSIIARFFYYIENKKILNFFLFLFQDSNQKIGMLILRCVWERCANRVLKKFEFFLFKIIFLYFSDCFDMLMSKINF